jgi:hypothetical protein
MSEADLMSMRRVDELHLKHSFYGARRLATQLVRDGFELGRAHATTDAPHGIGAIYRRPPVRLPLVRLPRRSIFSGSQKADRPWPRSTTRINYDDQNLRQNASRDSINRQFYPPIDEENLAELPEPPLLSIVTWRWLALGFVIRNLGVNSAIIGRDIAIAAVN